MNGMNFRLESAMKFVRPESVLTPVPLTVLCCCGLAAKPSG